MTTPDLRWITEAEVADAIDLRRAIDVVEAALPALTGGGAVTMEKTHAVWGDGHTVHALGGVLGDAGVVGVKVWAHTGGATPLLVLWEAGDGHAVAVVEAFALGQLRTAAMTAVATRWLSRPESSVLAMIGSGRQAAAQVAAVTAVRPVAEVRVFSPTADHREQFAGQLRGSLDCEVVVADSATGAARGADIVTTATRARAPFLRGSDVAPGMHVNAVGAITPERREVDASLVARCPYVVTDGVAAARRLAAELDERTELVELSALIGTPRHDPAEVSLFKPLGLGLADVALGAALLELGLGARRIPAPARRAPSLFGPIRTGIDRAP